MMASEESQRAAEFVAVFQKQVSVVLQIGHPVGGQVAGSRLILEVEEAACLQSWGGAHSPVYGAMVFNCACRHSKPLKGKIRSIKSSTHYEGVENLEIFKGL